MKYSIWWTDGKCLSKFFLKRFYCVIVNYLCWERFSDIHDSIKENVLSFVRSKTLTNDLEAIVTSGACVIGSYIVVNVGIVKAVEIFIHLS